MPRPNPETWQEMVPCVTNFQGTTSTPSRIHNRTYTSVNSPGYPTVLVENPHSVVLKEEWRDPSAYWRREPTPFGVSSGVSLVFAKGPMDGTARGVAPGYRTQFAYDDTNVKNRAKTKVAHKVKGDQVNLGVSLAEAGQAFSMFGNVATRIADAYRALKHGDIRGIQRSFHLHPNHARSLLHRGPLDLRRHAPEFWLEMQYGWKPLLSDLYGAVEQLHTITKDGWLLRSSASAVETKKLVNKGVANSGIVLSDVERFLTLKARYTLHYWVDDNSSHTLSSWGLTNPLSVVWELVPYSFVVDWFIPVGDYLSTFDAYLGVTFRKGLESIVKDFRSVAQYRPAASDVYRTNKAGGVDSFRHLTYNRNVLTTFPRAGLPKLKNPFSALHAANAISLLSLAFDRRNAGR